MNDEESEQDVDFFVKPKYIDNMIKSIDMKQIHIRDVQMKRLCYIIVIILLFCVPLTRCESTSSSTSFTVIASGGGFSGWYILNGGTEQTFICTTPASDGSGYYTYTQSLDSPTSITINVNGLYSVLVTTAVYDSAGKITGYTYTSGGVAPQAAIDSTPAGFTDTATTTYSTVFPTGGATILVYSNNGVVQTANVTTTATASTDYTTYAMSLTSPFSYTFSSSTSSGSSGTSSTSSTQ
jgi:hypothetical protein